MALKAVTAPLGSPVGGSGTLNTIPRWTGATTLGDSALTQSGNDVTGAGAIRATGTSQTSPAFMRHDATNSGIYFPGTNEIGFTISGNHAMYISASRSVGIGTVSPWGALTVARAAGSDAYVECGGGGRTSAAATFFGQDAAGSAYVWNRTNQPVYFGTNNLTRATLGSTSLDISATAGYGLKLPATNGTTYNTDPNTLDCYAEKNLTAAMVAEGGGTITLSASTLRFTRIGRVVHIYGRLVIGSVSAGPAPSGRLRINLGLGANEYPGAYSAASYFMNGWAAGLTGTPQGIAIPSSEYLYIDRYAAGGVSVDCAAYAQANAEVTLSLTYTV